MGSDSLEDAILDVRGLLENPPQGQRLLRWYLEQLLERLERVKIERPLPEAAHAQR
jgi:hypothetical protein